MFVGAAARGQRASKAAHVSRRNTRRRAALADGGLCGRGHGFARLVALRAGTRTFLATQRCVARRQRDARRRDARRRDAEFCAAAAAARAAGSRLFEPRAAPPVPRRPRTAAESSGARGAAAHHPHAPPRCYAARGPCARAALQRRGRRRQIPRRAEVGEKRAAKATLARREGRSSGQTPTLPRTMGRVKELFASCLHSSAPVRVEGSV